jgi:hypothetical protein
MIEIEKMVQQSVNYDVHKLPAKLLTYDAYADNKAYQQDIVDGCVKIKLCKK